MVCLRALFDTGKIIDDILISIFAFYKGVLLMDKIQPASSFFYFFEEFPTF